LPCEIKIDITFPNKKELETIYQTLKIETSEKDIKRGFMEIYKNELDLTIRISADDLVAARSLSNSILRLLKTSTDVIDIVTIEK
jgi:tRNA threonylcarbamoyladenosine modification (KEOPS) complex  Pcc1 subunit